MKNISLLTFLLLSSFGGLAQNQPNDYLYFTTGKITKGRIINADEEKISTRLLETGGQFIAQREKFLIFFSKSGNYLPAKDISEDATKAQQQISALYAEPTDSATLNDVLVKALPREVIPCTISNVLEDAVNYLTMDGKSASVNKENLLAIIRRDGSHELPGNLTDAVDILASVSAEVRQARITPKPAVAETPKTEPTSVATAPPAKALSLAELKSAEPEVDNREIKRLTNDEQRIYKAKSVDKMEELASLLNEIVDPRRSRAEKNEAIKRARKMFIKEAKVEISAINNPGNKTSRDIGDYLDRLSRLNYSRAYVTYAEITFVEEFEPDDQGNFWGLASYVQNFRTNTFNDLTAKRQRIKLQPYNKTVNGLEQEKFEVLLGNISINVE